MHPRQPDSERDMDQLNNEKGASFAQSLISNKKMGHSIARKRYFLKGRPRQTAAHGRRLHQSLVIFYLSKTAGLFI